jgi:hypothetical protein
VTTPTLFIYGYLESTTPRFIAFPSPASPPRPLQVPAFSSTFAWGETEVYIATPFALEMGERMCDYEGNLYGSDLRKNMVVTLKEWLRFQKNPAAYAEDLQFDCPEWTVQRARDQLADSKFEEGLGAHTTLTPASASRLVEQDLMFYQHAFVCVTANANVLSPEDARIHLFEPWRFGVWVDGPGGMLCQPVDFGCFKCQHCRQFAKYQFCVHCIVVGTLQREGNPCIFVHRHSAHAYFHGAFCNICPLSSYSFGA